MNRFCKAAITLILLSLIGCGGSGNSGDIPIVAGRYQDLYLNHYKSECSSFELRLCLLAKQAESEAWSYLSGSIEGFDFEWGYNYQLRVEVDEIENPPEDSSSVSYKLVEITEQEQEPASTLFDISVSRSSGLLVKKSDNIYTLYGEKDIECSEPVCSNIDSLIQQDMAILFQLRHQNDPSDPLTVVQIKCSDDRASFAQSCR